MQYREPLPPDCPPPEAQAITAQTVRYRLLETTTARPEDFDSYVKRNGQPKPNIARTTCEQYGVSLYTDLDTVQNMITGRGNRKRRWQSIGQLTIPPGAGALNPVERNGHQTWWPSISFNPVENCQVIL